MEISEIQKLKYRRQYLFTPKNINCPFLFNKTQLNNYNLYTHIDLVVTKHRQNNVKLILLGDIFYYDEHYKGNKDILIDLINFDFTTILDKIENYTGRFVLLYQKNDEINLVHDNTASRKIFYAKINEELWFASQPYLLASLLDLQKTKNASKLAFYNSEDFTRLHNGNIGNTTLFDEIFQVLPNHYFDVKNGKIIRFWPNKPIDPLDINETAQKCATLIKGYMENICARYNVMLPVTAGKDSRILLAATKDITNKVYYYVNKESRLGKNNKDIRIPKLLMTKLGLTYNIIDPYIPIDDKFIEIYFENNYNASKMFLPLIYNYYENFDKKINLPGSIASQAYYRLRYDKNNVNGEKLAELNKVNQYQYASEYYSDWLSGCRDICKKNNVHVLNLFYWEERLANWGTQIQLEKDIAQEEINPYNSKLLSSLFLSVDSKLLIPPNYHFHKKVIKCLWPETLQLPINPSFINTLKAFLMHFRLFNLAKFLKRLLKI